MELDKATDVSLLREMDRRLKEKSASIEEMEFLTKKLLELNEKARESEKIKSYFLSLIKNEFNNPLSTLLSLSKKIKKDVDIERLDAIGSMMCSELGYIDFSLKNIFSASEIEAGEIANDFARINPVDIANETIEYFAYLIRERLLNVVVSNEIEGKMITDAQKLYMILLNLLSNACEFSYTNANINIKFSEKDNNYEMRVEDFGEGIYEEHSMNIYNRFYKHSSGKTRPTQGLGLGLSVARGLTEALDGTLDNYRVNDKTVFIAKIPIPNEKGLSLAEGLGSDEFFEDVTDNSLMEF